MSAATQELPSAEGPAALVKHEATNLTPMDLISAAMENGIDPNHLEKLLALQERWDENERRKAEHQAEIAYNQAMAECQAAIQPVKAKLKNTQTNSIYADLTAIDDAIRPVYTSHGFSISEGSSKSDIEDNVYVYIDVLHRDGHSKRYGDDFPLDGAGIKGTVNKTAIHAKASTKTYARRYLITGVFNIAIARHDRDGNDSDQPISEKHVGILRALINSCHPDENAEGRALKFAQVETLEEIPSRMFLTVKQKLTELAEKYAQ